MCLQNNTQTTPTKPGSSPNSAAAKPISTPKTPAKLTSLCKTTPTNQVTDEEVKTTHGKPTPAEGESKATVGRRRLHVKGSAAPVASAARRASLRSAPEEITPDSMQTSAIVTPRDVPGATVKRRGRKPAMRNAVAETAGTATTTTTNPSKASETVSKKPVEDPNDRQPTAETILASTEKEKSTDNLTQAPDSRAVSQQAGSSSTSGDTEEATKPAATRRKVSKVTTVTAADVKDGCENLFNQKVSPHGWKSGNYELLLLLLLPLLFFLLFQLIKFWCTGYKKQKTPIKN